MLPRSPWPCLRLPSPSLALSPFPFLPRLRPFFRRSSHAPSFRQRSVTRSLSLELCPSICLPLSPSVPGSGSSLIGAQPFPSSQVDNPEVTFLIPHFFFLLLLHLLSPLCSPTPLKQHPLLADLRRPFLDLQRPFPDLW
ncbi:hypothetical protein RJT34_09302 [Clitoria ternatea]|uniref:Uncharacterized protein n=1 Tax=Clitoria ternatea TaxID=43366 RepID=A0AAN9K4T1_CLITE